MPKYNTKFELTPDDLELIETALRANKAELSKNAVEKGCGAAKDDLRVIHDLLGRLHNQKTFFRPSKGAYIGG